MSALELRCDRHLHMRFDPDREIVSVKCAQCSKDQQRPVFHAWPLREIVERYAEGEVSGVCQPKEPQFVFWKVKAA